METDFSDWDKGFKKLIDSQIPPELEKGIFAALNELLRDAKVEPPQAPKDVGDLWGSAKVDKPKTTKRDVIGVAGFNIVYAARWHEAAPNTVRWTRDKGASRPGPKYLEKKASRFKNKYVEIVGKFVEKLLRTGGKNV